MTRARDLAAFVSNADGDIKFDTDTLFIDSSANRVGIGLTNPTGSLHISNSAPSFYMTDTTNNTEGVVSMDNAGSLILNADLNNEASSSNIRFAVDGSEAMRIDSSGQVGIGTSSPSKELHVVGASTPEVRLQNSDNNYALDLKVNATVAEVKASASLAFLPAGSEAARFNSSGQLLIGRTTDASAAGLTLDGTGFCRFVRSGSTAGIFDRRDSDGTTAIFRRDGTNAGIIACYGGDIQIGTGNNNLFFNDGALSMEPRNADGTRRDNAIDMGHTNARFDDIRATNGTIQTSDQNEKQQIASLTSAEITAATAISKLFKTFKWNDKVEAKGDAARTHTGVIAQQVEQAMTDAGLTASNYAFWCSDTWWETQTEVAATEADEDNGIEAQDAYTRTDTYDTQEEAPEGATERNRKGIRYPELLSFIGAATEQRLTSIEARLDALEA